MGNHVYSNHVNSRPEVEMFSQGGLLSTIKDTQHSLMLIDFGGCSLTLTGGLTNQWGVTEGPFINYHLWGGLAIYPSEYAFWGTHWPYLRGRVRAQFALVQGVRVFTSMLTSVSASFLQGSARWPNPQTQVQPLILKSPIHKMTKVCCLWVHKRSCGTNIQTQNSNYSMMLGWTRTLSVSSPSRDQ